MRYNITVYNLHSRCGGVLHMQCWLDRDKPIVRQLPQHRLDFRFIVKFYTPDPGLLEEEYTRSNITSFH